MSSLSNGDIQKSPLQNKSLSVSKSKLRYFYKDKSKQSISNTMQRKSNLLESQLNEIESPDIRKNDPSEIREISSASSVSSLDIKERPLNKASIQDQIQRHQSYNKRTCVPNRGEVQAIENLSYESYGYQSPKSPRNQNDREHSQQQRTLGSAQFFKAKSIVSNQSDELVINDESFTIKNCQDKQSIQFRGPTTPQSRLSQNTKLTASFMIRRRTSPKEENTYHQQILKQINSRAPEMRRSHLKIQKSLKLKNIKSRLLMSSDKLNENSQNVLAQASKDLIMKSVQKTILKTTFKEKFSKQLHVIMKNSVAITYEGTSPTRKENEGTSLNSSYDSQGNPKISDNQRKIENSRNVFKQGLMYHMAKLKLRRADNNFNQIEQITQKFIDHKIAIVKYNSSIDASVQDFSSFDGFMQLDPTGQQLIITNKKPAEKPLYVLEADPNLVVQQQIKFKDERNETFNKLKTKSQSKIVTIVSDQPGLLEYHPKEMDGYVDEAILKEQVEVKKLYKLKKSDASCLLSDIQGFTYGGVSSRFWLMRKQFNQINFLSEYGIGQKINQEEKYDKAFEFFPWQCISLDMGHSTTFLVIKNEIVMRNFIKLLIYQLKTIDGRKGSALPIHAQLVNAQISETSKVWRNVKLSKDQNEKISKRCWHQIITKVSLKYLVQKIRCKLNYQAFVKNQTILELFLRSINNSFADFIQQGTIQSPQSYHKINSFYQKITGQSLLDEQIINEEIKTNYMSSQFSVFLLIVQMNIDMGIVQSQQLNEMMNLKTKPTQKEAVMVKRKGENKPRKVFIDEQKQKQCASLIKQLTDKNNCFDLFQQAEVNGQRMYEDKPTQNILRYKYDLRHWNRLYIKIRLIISLRAVKGELYILLQLWLIQIAKKLFVLEIEQGLATFIPIELSQDRLPMCLRYYDPILNIVYINVSAERRQYFNLQNNFHMSRIADDDTKFKFFKMLGIIPDDNYVKTNLIFKHQVINKQKIPQKPTDSSHNMMLQRSKYLIIENDVNQLKKQYYLDKNAAIQMCDPHNDIVLRYCSPDEVNQRRQQFLVFMGSYLNKINNLKFQGQQIDTMAKTEEFLNENIHSLIKQPGLQNFVKKETLKKSANERISNFSQERIMIDTLMEHAQKMVLKRRKALKRARLEEIKIKLLPKNSYQDRSTYIERSINDCMKYFTQQNSMSESDEERRAKHMMLHIRRILIKQECAIHKLKNRNESKERQEQLIKEKIRSLSEKASALQRRPTWKLLNANQEF